VLARLVILLCLASAPIGCAPNSPRPVATVLGQPIYAGDVTPTQEEMRSIRDPNATPEKRFHEERRARITSRIIRPLEARYVQEHDLRPTEGEVEQFVRGSRARNEEIERKVAADLVAQKRLKVLAVGTRQPWSDFPGVPTLEEMGLRGFDATAPWVGVLAPAGTPPAIVNRVSAEMRKSLARPETQARMKQLGAITVADNPAEFAAFLRKDHERWAQVIKTAGIKAE